MFIHSKLVMLILVLTLDDQVHSGEIIGGQEAVPHSRPYMVLLKRHLPDGERKSCGGFLLSQDFVMTAAHCQAKSYTALLGVHNLHDQDGRQHVSVEQTFVHKGYNATEFSNDIMLLKLSSKANINNNVRPIPLAGQGDGSPPQPCTVSGWGRTDTNGKQMSLILMKVSVTLTHNDYCAENNVYCSEGEPGPDKGDSGGPLVCSDGQAYGVVSAKKTLDSGVTISKYTKIPDNRDWIDYIMEQNGNH